MNIEVYTEAARDFINKYKAEITKQLIFEPLPTEANNFGHLEERDTHFIVRVKTDLPPAAHDANICHELFHAVQMSRGFPSFVSVRPLSYVEEDFFSNLSAMVLDMSVNDVLRDEGLDCSYFFNQRFKVMQSLCDRNFDKVTDDFYSIFLSVNLTLFYTYTSVKKAAHIKSRVQSTLPVVSQNVAALQNIINTNGYKMPEQAFLSLGHTLNHFDLWSLKGIQYQGVLYKSRKRFEKFISANDSK